MAKRATKPEHRNFPIVRLDRGNLEDIARIFSERFERVEIKVDAFVLEDISAVADIPKGATTELSIHGYEPGLVSLECSHFNARVYCSDMNDDLLRGVAERLGEILRRARSLWRFVVHPASIVLFVVAETLLLTAPFEKTTLRIMSGVAIAVGLAWGILTYWIATRRHSIILLVEHPLEGFFRRNRDQLFIALIAAIAGAAIGSVTTWLLTR